MKLSKKERIEIFKEIDNDFEFFISEEDMKKCVDEMVKFSGQDNWKKQAKDISNLYVLDKIEDHLDEYYRFDFPKPYLANIVREHIKFSDIENKLLELIKI
jgi:hypothetical protein